ncbi:MAG TPA: zf-HC2 domain-containing protein [Blastocatellia bacterium]|nr:zf-HC2 domain-containing protein [Blastocatellia bacterium]
MAEQCPNEESLAAYVDHALSPEERARIEAHLADCTTCRMVVALVAQSQVEVPDPPGRDES